MAAICILSAQQSCLKMLIVFEKPPEELKLPSTLMGLENMKSRQEIGEIIRSFWPESMVYNLRNGNFMASSHENESPSQPRYYTLNLIANALLFFRFQRLILSIR